MSTPILATKLFIPQSRQHIVVRPRLSEQLNESARRKLTLLSAPAGFGKTTLLGEWCAAHRATKIAWLALDEGDSVPARFLTYLVAALQTIAPQIGAGIMAVLQAPQPPPAQAILTVLLNEIAALPEPFILILDDYHLIDSAEIDDALAFLVEHVPPQMHLIIATRQDPPLPLSQLRARDQLLELRAADLRFTFSEAAEFLNRVMGLNLSAQEIAALETRTEGWVAGLQLAALSMRGLDDTARFIQSFTGSHRFVLDYLLEQVLQQQPQAIQNFLLCTSILDRLCGPLCDAVLMGRMTKDERPMIQDAFPSSVVVRPSSEILAELERANLFIFPLDNERHWYRYHHLFGDLLRQRLHQQFASAPTEMRGGMISLHERASEWYENNGMMFDAFRHAAAANNVTRATRLLDSGQMPFHFPGAVNTILDWLNSLPQSVLDANPALWWRAAALSLILGLTSGVQEKLQAAEDGMKNAERTDATRDLIGRIATARATLALTRYEIENILVQSTRALEYLGPNNLADRTSARWTQGVAYFFMGERAAARDAVNQAMQLAQQSGSSFALLLATTTSGTLQEVDNELDAAAETYRRALELAGEPALSFASDAQLGLARIEYEWNDLDAAQRHADKSLELARQYDKVIDRYLLNLVFLARVQLARGDEFGAHEFLALAEHDAGAKGFALRLPDIAVQKILTLLHQGNVSAAAQLAKHIEQPMIRARVLLAQGNARAALALLEQYYAFVQSKHWADEELKVLVLQAVALDAAQERANSLAKLNVALTLAERANFIRLFVDEGEAMRLLISDFRFSILKTFPHLSAYLEKLLAAFQIPQTKSEISNQKSEILIEPLSERELEILHLIEQGYSNQEISERLFLALSTVKGHNRILFDKLQVKNRTEAVARARALNLL